jgi:hypothetical protein
MQLSIPFIVIFPRAAQKPAHNNGCGLWPQKGWMSMVYVITGQQLEYLSFQSKSYHKKGIQIYTQLSFKA